MPALKASASIGRHLLPPFSSLLNRCCSSSESVGVGFGDGLGHQSQWHTSCTLRLAAKALQVMHSVVITGALVLLSQRNMLSANLLAFEFDLPK